MTEGTVEPGRGARSVFLVGLVAVLVALGVGLATLGEPWRTAALIWLVLILPALLVVLRFIRHLLAYRIAKMQHEPRREPPRRAGGTVGSRNIGDDLRAETANGARGRRMI